MNLKLKRNKGITLIALIITIIVLLILAVVAIRAVTGDGILAHARNARDKWIDATANEEAMLGNLTNYITEQSGNNPPPGGEQVTPMKDAQNKVLSAIENKKVEDEYGNIVVVPAGFKIVVDDTTTYADKENPHVTDGIVIEDVSAGNQGSQFVWVPIGEVKKEGTTENIIFGRYSWNRDTGVGTIVQSATKPEDGGFNAEVPITSGSYNYTELKRTESGTGPNGNALAKDIVEFCGSVSTNGGYYIGRYEAGDSIATSKDAARTGTNGTSTEGALVCKKDQYVYNWITQPDASKACQDMYTGKTFTSDLVNSYAWDTAIIFIQQCGTESDAGTYASLNKSTGFKNTGENNDQYRNINDMSGNAYEWTTEASSNDSGPCAGRGGCYVTDLGNTGYYTSYRFSDSTSHSFSAYSFRPLLYL